MNQSLRLISTAAIAAFVLGLNSVKQADASHILLVGNSPSAFFSDGLDQYGHTVTIGPHNTAFDGSLDLSQYDVVVLAGIGFDDPNSPLNGMSLAGQQSIESFVAGGGGLVTGGWLSWKAHTFPGTFDLIYSMLPITTNGSYVQYIDSVIYEQVTPDPTLNAGLPASFPISLVSSGAEYLAPRPGATVFYSGNDHTDTWLSAGVVGWDYGQGRVMSFSTLFQQPVGPDYIDPYSRLISNAIQWADDTDAEVPEPASLALFATGALALGFVARRRRYKGEPGA